MQNQPDVIFFDAVGTLFGVRGSVGQIYGAIAAKYQVKAVPETLDQAFRQSFKSAPRSDQGDAYAWWREITRNTFSQAGVLRDFTDFEDYFAEIYGFFATGEAWYVYEDVLSTLRHWQTQGVSLGIISNFDQRIYPVLAALQLDGFFTSVTISTEVGAAKPDAQIFQAAIALYPHHQNFWHIGDSHSEDYEGAVNAGLRGIWLDRYSETRPASYAIRGMTDLLSL